MSDEATLRQAVIDDPDDDAPRLAYADWCAQQSDPLTQARAELIRAQVEFARGGAPSLFIHKISSLVESHGTAWAAPIAPYVRDYWFLGGFVEHVELSAQQFLDHGAELYELAPIRHIDLVDVREVDETLFASPLFAQVRSLRIDRLGLYDIHLQLLAASPHIGELRWLSGTGNNFNHNGYTALAKSTTLSKLAFVEFDSNPVDPVEQLFYDGAEIVAAQMPPAGEALEQRFGRLAWLHREPKVPGRYVLP